MDRPRRRGGSLARLEAVRVLRAVDAALASTGGLRLADVAEAVEVHPETIRRYILDLIELGQVVGGERPGVFRYAAGVGRIFSPHGDDLLA